MDIAASVLTVAADSLALAVIASSNAPVLLLDDDLTVIAASESFCGTYGVELAETVGAKLSGLGEGEWAVPQLESLLKATAAGYAAIDAYEMDLVRKGRMSRRLIVNARKLDYFDAEHVRLVMSVADVTEARINEKLKDDLLHEKEILLQELQHRVANSLQIIASVLMQSARRVQSEQARGHLRDARNRVMSIAALQRQLSASKLGDVALRTYFSDLCDTIGASMIGDHDQLSLSVERGRKRGRGGSLGKPRPDRHRTGDQRPQARLSAPSEGRDPGRISFQRNRLDAVRPRHGHRHACGSCQRQTRARHGDHRSVGPPFGCRDPDRGRLSRNRGFYRLRLNSGRRADAWK